MQKNAIKTSKFLSLVLRHRPETIGISLDAGGWVDIDELLKACASHGKEIAMQDLLDVVASNDKQRFIIEGNRIRANQGHSVEVQLALEPSSPPEYLYHGTAERNWTEISRSGLLPMDRHHVHLSPDRSTAHKVGSRHGKPIVLRVAAQQMVAEGSSFYRSANGVWLCDAVPARYLVRPEE